MQSIKDGSKLHRSKGGHGDYAENVNYSVRLHVSIFIAFTIEYLP